MGRYRPIHFTKKLQQGLFEMNSLTHTLINFHKLQLHVAYGLSE